MGIRSCGKNVTTMLGIYMIGIVENVRLALLMMDWKKIVIKLTIPD
jgi:hypothetical protein